MGLGNFLHVKRGWREIGDRKIYFRSRMEANYGRFLEWQRQKGIIANWEHEAETFWFDGIRRGVTSYLPDFKIWWFDGTYEYHEVKGWMDGKSKTKIKRFKKYFPQFKLFVIGKKEYNELEKMLFRMVPGWET